MASPFPQPNDRPRMKLSPALQERLRRRLALGIAEARARRPLESQRPVLSVKGGKLLSGKKWRPETIRDLVRKAHEGEGRVPGGVKRLEVRKREANEAGGRITGIVAAYGSREIARRVFQRK